MPPHCLENMPVIVMTTLPQGSLLVSALLLVMETAVSKLAWKLPVPPAAIWAPIECSDVLLLVNSSL